MLDNHKEECNHDKKKWKFITTERRNTGETTGLFSNTPIYEDASIYQCECGMIIDSKRNWGLFL